MAGAAHLPWPPGPPVVLGAGAVGGYVAANLQRNGLAPVAVSRWPQHRAAVAADGLAVTWPDGSRSHHSMRCLDPDELAGVRTGVVFLTVKGDGTAAYADLAAQLLIDGGVIISFQNGVQEPYLADRFGPEAVIGGSALVAVERTAPGQIRLTSRACTLMLGALHLARQPAAHAVADRLAGPWCRTVVSDNIIGVVWSKLLNNHRVNGICLLSGQSIGDTLAQPRWRRISLALLAEGASVAAAAGVRLEPLPTVDMPALVAAVASDPATADHLVRGHAHLLRDVKPSTLQDFERQQATELDHLSGFVVAQAQRYAVEAPVSRTLLRLAAEVERERNRPAGLLDALESALT